jgi:hypothetical protein
MDMIRQGLVLGMITTGCTIDVEDAVSFTTPTVTMRARTQTECAEGAAVLSDVLGLWSAHESIHLTDGGCIVDPDGPDIADVVMLPTTHHHLEILVVDEIVTRDGLPYGGWLKRTGPCDAGVALRGLDEVVLAHEIGHWLGLPHVLTKSNLMHHKGATLHLEPLQLEQAANDLRRQIAECG